MIKEGEKDINIMQLQKLIDSKAYSLETDWVSKEDAATELQEQLGEDFISFLGYMSYNFQQCIYLEKQNGSPSFVFVEH